MSEGADAIASQAEYWEAHVTMKCTGAEREHVEALGWTYSNITDDPVLGPGEKCYATRQFNAKRSHGFVVMEVHSAANVLARRGVTVLREKVERVVYDRKRTRPVEVRGHGPECLCELCRKIVVREYE